MPSQEDFSRLEAFAAGVALEAVGHPYARWLSAKGKGLKAEAQAALDAFLADTLRWPEVRRRAFIVWLSTLREQLDDPRVVTPHPLMTRLVLPTLRDWVRAEPAEATPHLMLGLFHDHRLDETWPLVHFRAALDRDPDLDRARLGVVRGLIDAVDWSQHLYPDVYNGDRDADVRKMDEAIRLAGALEDAKLGRQLVSVAGTLRDRALSA